MAVEVAALAGSICVSAVSAVLVSLLIRRFHAAGIVDLVGARSSHTQPTARGGGLGFVIAATAAWLVVAWGVPGMATRTLLGVSGAGAAVAVVGLIDDIRGVPAFIRLLVHLVAAAIGLWAVVDWPTVTTAWPIVIVAVVALAWFVNAFNFMDGTDAFAATHGIMAAGVMATLLLLSGHGVTPASVVPLGVAAGVLGFLPFNWPRARVFMGDVGSGWLGLMVALSLGMAWKAEPHVAFASLTMLSPFMMDPTVCLVRRVVRGDRVWQAHRSHGFQNLSRRLGSHARLLTVWWGLSLAVYVPLSFLAWRSGWWPWLPVAVAAGVGQALVLGSGVAGIADPGPSAPSVQCRH